MYGVGDTPHPSDLSGERNRRLVCTAATLKSIHHGIIVCGIVTVNGHDLHCTEVRRP